MCGIVGAASRRNIVPVLIEGLRKLEYRGYDSCGLAVMRNGGIGLVKTVSRVSDLAARVNGSAATTGVAHTRWATHGAPAAQNAHPIVSRGEIAVVHNGIVENHEVLRAELQALGYHFESETDTEVIAHLVHSLYEGDLLQAVRLAVKRLHGSYAVAIVAKNEPGNIVGARAGSPLVLGVGLDENFLASDAMALAGVTDRMVYLEEGDVVCITDSAWRLIDGRGIPVTREIRVVQAHGAAAELGPYRHFMQKEIFEQPRAVADTVEHVSAIEPALFGGVAELELRDIESVLVLACGTSHHAGLVARHWIEGIAGLRCAVDIASEYRYGTNVAQPKTLVVAISQSGETADTLAALKHAQSAGHGRSLALCNVASSALMRMATLQFVTRAGIEIGVASTKAFTTQLTALFLLTLTLAKLRGRLGPEQEAAALKSLRHLPSALHAVLALEPQIIAWAERFAEKEHALFLGRGLHYPIALEGALKLKEVSYIHAEAYPAGELKHGPLALVSSEMPVVTIAPNDGLIDKLKSNMQEVRARGGELYAFADADARITEAAGIHVLRLPEHYGALSPILHVVPLQLLAYHAALARGRDVDKWSGI
jgi:glucosamine--fructose-6-phosphate aminotransferase (isomerizing)